MPQNSSSTDVHVARVTQNQEVVWCETDPAFPAAFRGDPEEAKHWMRMNARIKQYSPQSYPQAPQLTLSNK